MAAPLHRRHEELQKGLSHIPGFGRDKDAADRDRQQTSLHDLGMLATMPELDMALAAAFAEVFGAPLVACPAPEVT